MYLTNRFSSLFIFDSCYNMYPERSGPSKNAWLPALGSQLTAPGSRFKGFLQAPAPSKLGFSALALYIFILALAPSKKARLPTPALQH